MTKRLFFWAIIAIIGTLAPLDGARAAILLQQLDAGTSLSTSLRLAGTPAAAGESGKMFLGMDVVDYTGTCKVEPVVKDITDDFFWGSNANAIHYDKTGALLGGTNDYVLPNGYKGRIVVEYVFNGGKIPRWDTHSYSIAIQCIVVGSGDFSERGNASGTPAFVFADTKADALAAAFTGFAPTIEITFPKNGSTTPDFDFWRYRITGSSSTELQAIFNYGTVSSSLIYSDVGGTFPTGDEQTAYKENALADLSSSTTWFARASLYDGLTDSIVATSSLISFNIAALGGEAGEAGSFGFVFNIREQAIRKPPFGYFVLIRDALTFSTSTSSSSQMIATTTAQLALVFDPLRNGISVILYTLGLFWFWHRFRNFDL